MHKIWLMFDPRQAFIAIHLFLFALAFIIHFTLLSTDKYNWIEGSSAEAAETAQNSALP